MPTAHQPPERSFSLSRVIAAARQEATGSKTTSYVTTTITTGVIFALITLIVILITPSSLQLFLWAALPFIFALTFSPIRYASEEMIRQLFPGTDYDSHSLIKHLNTISYSTLTLDTLTHRFFQELEANLRVSRTAFIIQNKPKPLIRTYENMEELHQFSNQTLQALIRPYGKEPLEVRHLKNKEVKQKLESLGLKLIIPLTNNEDTPGLLLLGEKDNGGSYTTKDKKVLEAIAPKIGFAILNAKQYQGIEHQNEKLISDLESTNRKLKKLNQELTHDTKLKDEFIYIATHELKNPVTAIEGYLSMLDENQFGPIPDSLKEPITNIKTSNQRLVGLLNNLLQIARVEAEKLEIKTQPVAICDIVDNVLKDLSPLAEQKNLVLDHNCPNPATTVMADSERLREIISNLISNAIKYSEKGTVTISYEIDQDHLVCHVKDQGVGISQDDQPQIFTRFFRVEEEAAKGIPGTGLGLYIIKQLLERMEGRIWFKSEKDEGSTFSFSLPLARTYVLHAR